MVLASYLRSSTTAPIYFVTILRIDRLNTITIAMVIAWSVDEF